MFGLGRVSEKHLKRFTEVRCTRTSDRARWKCGNTAAPGSRWCAKHLAKGKWMAKDWSKRDYKPRVVNENAEAEFALEFPDTKNPWGQSPEMDALIKQGQSDSPGLDRTFLGVRVERCTRGVSIQMLAPEDASTETVELVARTLHPDAGDWTWDERAIVEHVEGGWLITLQNSGENE